MNLSIVTPVNNIKAYQANVVASLEGIDGLEFIPIVGAASASIALNQGIEKAKYNLVVCCHQDVIFSRTWPATLAKQIRKIGDDNFGVMGTFGVTIEPSFYAGNVKDPHSGEKHEYGKIPCEAMSLDEHCLIIRKDSGLRFNERLPGWHFYGADICLEAKTRGLKNYIIDNQLTHLSGGVRNDAFWNVAWQFVDLWRERKDCPFNSIYTTCGKFLIQKTGQVWVTIPTGERLPKSLNCVKAWKDAGFKVAVATWDKETFESLKAIADFIMQTEKMQTFAENTNFLSRQMPWEVLITGADDLWPVNTPAEFLECARRNEGKIIWVKDMLFNQQPTHPVVTRRWFDRHSSTIFAEVFRHNCCDTDLFYRAHERGEVVKNFKLACEHRHWLKNDPKNNKPKDRIYQIGLATAQDDLGLLNTIHPGKRLVSTAWQVPEAA